MNLIRRLRIYNCLSLTAESKMANNELLDCWLKLQSSRADWVFRAYDRLLASLSKDISEKLRLHNQKVDPYIVIYGKTQVGKTTLLLDLLGIDPQQISKVSKTLRGGREAGKSATATAMEYCRSVDDSWGLAKDSELRCFESNEDLSEALEQIRAEMERGQLVVDSPCVVHIPQHFFIGNADGLNVRILDLPGDNPASANEQCHVNEMAKRYLPFADLVLLVGRGDDLSFLTPEVIAIPGIEDWQAMPQHFRIVTTFSYEPQSVRDFIRQLEGIDPTQIRQRLLHEIEKFGQLSTEAKDLNLYFPMEFGQSWTGLESKEPDLYRKIKPIIDNLRHELLDQIQASVSPMGRVRNVWNTHQSIKYISQKNDDRIARGLEELSLKEKAIRDDLDALEKHSGKIVAKLLEYRSFLDFDSRKHISNSLNCKVNNLELKSRSPRDNRDTLFKMIRDAFQQLSDFDFYIAPPEGFHKKYWHSISSVVESPSLDFIRNIAGDEFYDIKTKLDSYFLDAYYISSNYDSDECMVFQAWSKAKKIIADSRYSAWVDACNEVSGKITRYERHLKSKVEMNSDEISRLQSALVKTRTDIELLEKERHNNHVSSQKDLEHCEFFAQLIKQEYECAYSTSFMELSQVEDDCDCFIKMLSCIEMTNDYERLLSHIKS
jgi:hypothetical protein